MNNINQLPEKLQDDGLFCVWKYEARRGQAKSTKVPYQANGARAKTNDRRSFCDYQAALTALPRYDGLGLGIFNSFSAIDIDHCIDDNGNLSTVAQDIVDIFNGCYTEISPSGRGLRILFQTPNFRYDTKRYYINNAKLGLEVYVSGATSKFVTITGNVYKNGSIINATAQLQILLDRYMQRTAPLPSTLPKPCPYLTDEQVIQKATHSKNAAEFLALWNGVPEKQASHSEADLALCSHLAFWCGGDTEQMDRLFRQSGLMRDKWERDDYRNATLKRAVTGKTEFYKPMEFLENNDLLLQLIEMEIHLTPRYSLSDIGAGRLLADIYQNEAKYIPERKKWYIYDGSRWAADIGGLKIMEKTKDLADALLRYCLTVQDEDKRKALLNHYQKWQQHKFRETYIKEAQSVYPASVNDFDNDRYLFNCRNGTIDLHTMDFYPHNPADMITKISPADYKPSAKSERFTKFIDEITSGDNEKKVFLQKILAYALSGDTKHECMFFLYGATTRNGKGTLMESILSVMGDYGKTVRPETIAQKQNTNSQSPSEDIARLMGIRFANISEPSKGLVLNAALVKSMTGNDTLNARMLNENSFDFQPQFKLYINANYLPVINDMTLFSSGRVIIIPFDRHFDECEQDKTLKEEFRKPETQSAILNWLLEGYRLLAKEGLTVPQSVTVATQAYYHDSDKLQQFQDDCLEASPFSEVKTADVYRAYRDWCLRNGCYAENNRNFNTALRTIGKVTRKRPSFGGEKTTVLLGHKLKEEALFG